MKEHVIMFVIVVVAVITAQFLATKVLKLNSFEDEYEMMGE